MSNWKKNDKTGSYHLRRRKKQLPEMIEVETAKADPTLSVEYIARCIWLELAFNEGNTPEFGNWAAASWFKHLKDTGYGWATIDTVRRALKQVAKEKKAGHRVWIETFDGDKGAAVADLIRLRGQDKADAAAKTTPTPAPNARTSAFAALLSGRDGRLPSVDDEIMAQIPHQKRIAAAVIKILRAHGYWEAFNTPKEGGAIEFHLRIENEPYMKFVIERHSNTVSLAHYGMINDDVARDPEMCFELPSWRPTMFQNDYAGYYSEDIPPDDSFPAAWAANLIEQGFADPQRCVVSSLTHPPR